MNPVRNSHSGGYDYKVTNYPSLYISMRYVRVV